MAKVLQICINNQLMLSICWCYLHVKGQLSPGSLNLKIEAHKTNMNLPSSKLMPFFQSQEFWGISKNVYMPSETMINELEENKKKDS